MSVLTLVENAVKHGPAKGFRGRIVVSIVEQAGEVTIAIENPGPYGGPRAGSDGLPTLVRQLHLATNGALHSPSLLLAPTARARSSSSPLRK
jgi:LytS/YehU family sensor histidine kinase